MCHCSRLIAACLAVLTCTCAVMAEAPAGFKYDTVWADEFNYTGVPDASKWSYYNGPIGNGEVQAYTNSSKNAYVENGHLRLTAIKETYSTSRKTYDYTSARIDTHSKFTVQYGRIEISAKMPAGIGCWPAFWTLGSNAGWPNGGEIDIVEYSPGKTDNPPANYINRNFIYRTSDGNIRNLYNFTFLHDITPTDGYHTYALEWDHDWMRWYYDDICFATSQTTPEVLDAYPGTTPSANPHYIILNLAMGGSGGGGIDPNFTSDSFLVDYVRVSKLVPIPEPASLSLLALGSLTLLRRRKA